MTSRIDKGANISYIPTSESERVNELCDEKKGLDVRLEEMKLIDYL